MFDIGFWELVIIAIVALLVVGPEQLPGFARETGRWLGRFRKFMYVARSELTRELRLHEPTEFEKNIAGLDQLMQNAPDQRSGTDPEPLEEPEGKSEPASK
jgi:twin arginine-targeting protein translocase TatB